MKLSLDQQYQRQTVPVNNLQMPKNIPFLSIPENDLSINCHEVQLDLLANTSQIEVQAATDEIQSHDHREKVMYRGVSYRSRCNRGALHRRPISGSARSVLERKICPQFSFSTPGFLNRANSF